MSTLRYGSVCSGIEAVTVAWHGLGFEPQWFAEIAPFPSAVLTHRFPHVPNLGDFTRIDETAKPIDLLVGGTPCQSFSVAGLRGGLADDRGNLALEFLRLAQRTRPQWVVWENVPGVLSSSGGRDFGAILGGLAELGYGFAYRVLDAQFFGVPQRRRRVFVVGHLGDWRRAAAVLFERHGLSWDPPPRREAGAGVAGSLGAGPTGRGWRIGADEAAGGQVVAVTGSDGERALTAHAGRYDLESETFIAIQSINMARDRKQNGIGISESDAMYSLTSRDQHAVAYRTNFFGAWETGDRIDALTTMTDTGIAPAVNCSQHHKTRLPHGVRRLMPVECERLQGFPDGWTLVPYNGKPAKDGPRYKAIGNSMAVPVVRWIGRRIMAVARMA